LQTADCLLPTVFRSGRSRSSDQHLGSGAENQLFAALNEDRAGAAAAADGRANGCALPASCNAADDCAKRRTTNAAHGSIFRPAAAFNIAFFVNGLDALGLIHLLELRRHPSRAAIPQPNRIE